MTRLRIIQAGTVALALISLGTGLWAIAAPHSFFDSAATYPPYNEHFIRDIGAFLLGLGSCLVAGLVVRDALLAVLAGNAIGLSAHFVGHAVDRLDPAPFAVLALVALGLTVARWAAVRR